MIKLIGLICTVTTLSAFSCDQFGITGFAPKNDQRIPVGASKAELFNITGESAGNGISEQEFHQAIDEVSAVYDPIFEQHDLRLKVNRKWKNDTVNATALQAFFLGKQAQVNMYGGLARHPLTTKDSFAIVLCHEIGHHLGGAPKRSGLLFGQSWASNEGQSDYFATLVCFKNVYGTDDNVKLMANVEVHEHISQKCEAVYDEANEIALCNRALMASKSTSDLLHSLRVNSASSNTAQTVAPYPWFNRFDKKIVTTTNDNHPAAQCRLDTYSAGALCDRPIENFRSGTDADQGSCNRRSNDQIGVRPLCWFKPATN